jgi:hypothetical protein
MLRLFFSTIYSVAFPFSSFKETLPHDFSTLGKMDDKGSAYHSQRISQSKGTFQHLVLGTKLFCIALNAWLIYIQLF